MQGQSGSSGSSMGSPFPLQIWPLSPEACCPRRVPKNPQAPACPSSSPEPRWNAKREKDLPLSSVGLPLSLSRGTGILSLGVPAAPGLGALTLVTFLFSMQSLSQLGLLSNGGSLSLSLSVSLLLSLSHLVDPLTVSQASHWSHRSSCPQFLMLCPRTLISVS